MGSFVGIVPENTTQGPRMRPHTSDDTKFRVNLGQTTFTKFRANDLGPSEILGRLGAF